MKRFASLKSSDNWHFMRQRDGIPDHISLVLVGGEGILFSTTAFILLEIAEWTEWPEHGLLGIRRLCVSSEKRLALNRARLAKLETWNGSHLQVAGFGHEMSYNALVLRRPLFERSAFLKRNVSLKKKGYSLVTYRHRYSARFTFEFLFHFCSYSFHLFLFT